jgi:hypothetical protein
VPDWRDDAAAAVDVWMAAEGRGGRKPERAMLGDARPEGDGWYAVDLRGKQQNPDQLDGLRLESPGRDRHYLAREVVHDGEILRVRVSRHITEPGLRLFALKRPTGLLLEKLRDGLLGLSDAGGLAHRLARGQLDPLPAHLSEPPPAGLTPGQERAFNACLTPGVRLIWGPPGTGKTLVLARAIDRLVERGLRVLLVSGTNVAVDNALMGVMRLRQRPPGTLVRVGPPQIREVADDESVSLPRLKESRAPAKRAELQRVEDRLVELTTPVTRRQELDKLLSGHDPVAYAAAARRLELDGRIRDLAQCLHELTRAADDARTECDHAEHALREAEHDWQTIEPGRLCLEQAAALRREIEDLQIAGNRAWARHAQMVDRQESTREHLSEEESARGIAWLRNRSQARRLREEVARLVVQVERLRQDAETAERLADDQRRLLVSRIADLEREAAPLDPTQVETRQVALGAARRLAADTAKATEAAARRVAPVRADLLAAEALPRATADQHRLVASADAAGWPELHAERERLRSEEQARAADVRELERRHGELLHELERLERDTEREIIGQARLVATTLARFRLHPAVAGGPYDTVLVDEVGAATLVDVLLPVAAARHTAVLLGDFLQLGPVLKDEVRDHPDPHVQRWVTPTCFDRCGIGTPAEAKAHAACVVLDTQYRFGPDVMELANLTMYDGTLRADRERERSDLEHEVVLIDTDGLGEIARARSGPDGRSRWWPAGALLAPILADHHARRGERVGLISPYRPQADAMLEALHDTEGEGARLTTDAGTAHGFQGREFDVVVFDLVEDGEWPGWLADRRAERAASGARVLNVSVTRCKHRLYLVGSGRLIRSATGQPRTALSAVGALLEAGRIHVVKAAQLLQVPEAGAPMELDPVADELAETLASHVRVLGIHDERTYYAELKRCLGEANESVWMWAPWTLLRTEDMLPELRLARDRGIRVTVFVRTDDDWQMSKPRAQQELQRLREAVTKVVQMQRMHQKIVVLDRRTVMYGSLNTLSQRRSHEIMVIHQGAHFAEKLLDHEHAEVFGAPPNCTCGEQAAVLGMGMPRWQCARSACRWTEPVDLSRRRRTRNG